MSRFSSGLGSDPNQRFDPKALFPENPGQYWHGTSLQPVRLPSARQQRMDAHDIPRLLSPESDWMVNDRGWLNLLVDLYGKPFAIIRQALELPSELLPQVKQVVLAWYEEHIREEKVEAILYIEAADDAPEEIAQNTAQRIQLRAFFEQFGEATWLTDEHKGETYWMLQVPQSVFWG